MQEEKRMIICPDCKNPIEVSAADIEWGDIVCPKCKELIVLKKEDMAEGNTTYKATKVPVTFTVKVVK